LEVLKSAVTHFALDFGVEFVRYFVVAGLAYLLIWVILRKRLMHRLIQKKFPPNSRLRSEFLYSLSSMAIFAIIGVGVVFALKYGYGKLYYNIDDKGTLYFIFSVALAILIHDTYFYWTHRLMHHPKLYKHIHLVHHQSTNPSPWAAYSFHPYEAFIQGLIGPVIIFSIPIHVGALAIFAFYQIIYNAMGHSGFELLPKGFTKSKWFFWHNTTTHHNMHHRYFNYNFSIYYNWWDRIMGTMHPEYDEQYEEVTSREKITAEKENYNIPSSAEI
jgi:Delta7-sterol 5-desaturase